MGWGEGDGEFAEATENETGLAVKLCGGLGQGKAGQALYRGSEGDVGFYPGASEAPRQ